MIQDIIPHQYDNHYTEYQPTGKDFCICIQDGQALLCKDQTKKESWYIPTFDELKERFEGAVYLFAIDGKHYFLKQMTGEKDTGFVEDESNMTSGPSDRLQAKETVDHFKGAWKNRRDMREIMPRFIAFAGITALQLDGWYRNNRYCGHCGSSLQKDHKERMLYCEKCGNRIYPRINPAVIIAVTKGSKLLMTKYAGRTYTRYALVAGFTEIGETLEQTVAREVMEETGIRVKNLRYYKSQPWSFSDTLLTGFFCEADGEQSIRLDKEELSVAEWIERDQIDQVQDSYDDLSLTNEMIRYFRDHKEEFISYKNLEFHPCVMSY